MARSMLSFGIEYERAFSTAFCSARLAAGSAPPSFAATMIARDSFENSFPRFASAAPFLCLIEDHLLCPDTRRLPHRTEEQLVHARILRQLGVERRHEDATVAHQHRLAPVLREHLDVLPHGTDPRRPDEDAAQRLGLPFEPKIRFEACDLAAVGVPVDLEVDEAEMVAIEDDHPRAGAENGTLELANRFVEAVESHQTHERGGLAAGDDQPVQSGELLRLPDLHGVRAEATQHRRVLAKVALQSQNTDLHASILESGYRSSAAGITVRRRRASRSAIPTRTDPAAANTSGPAH